MFFLLSADPVKSHGVSGKGKIIHLCVLCASSEAPHLRDKRAVNAKHILRTLWALATEGSEREVLQSKAWTAPPRVKQHGFQKGFGIS